MRVLLGDTVQFSTTIPSTDDPSAPADLTGLEVDVVVPGVPDMSGPATIGADPTTGVVSYTTQSTTAGVFQVRLVVHTPDGVDPPFVRTVLGPALRVMDADAAWASIADIEALIGPQDDPEAVLRAIDAAMALIGSWLCSPVPEPLPAQFTMATAIVASAILNRPTPGSPVAETIGDYSYRLATAPDNDALRGEVRQLLGPWLCGTAHSVRVWPGTADCGCEAGAWAWQLYLDCFDHVDGFTDGYQPDAEGLVRG